MKYLCVFIGLLFANFIYQFSAPVYDWVVASERSFFQGVALFLAACIRSEA